MTVSFGLVTLVGIITVALLVNQRTTSQVRTFVVQEQVVSSGLLQQLSAYYTTHGSWDGVESILPSAQGGGSASATSGPVQPTATPSPEQSTAMDQHGGYGYHGGSGSDAGTESQDPPMGAGHMGHNGASMELTDSSGHVIYSGSGTSPTTQATQQALQDALPVTSDGKTVGYLIVTTPGNAALSAPATKFLEVANRSLIEAGIIAGLLGILFGILIARGLSSPLRRLAVAAERISEGAFDQRVPVRGSTEIAHLAHAFNSMATSLNESERQRQSMVADIAHELRTPLSVIQGNLRALLDDVYPLDKSEIATIYDETLMLGRLVSDLHNLAQAESGHLNLNTQPAELTPVVQRSAALFSEAAAEKGISVSVLAPEDLPRVTIDSDRTAQILHNLLANALRHTPEGGRITLVVEPRMAVEGSREPEALRISVSDTGPGIAAEDLPHVFERFWRSEHSRSREHGGSGLGLAIARALARGQGGDIGVESAPGRGTTFWFTVPVAPQSGTTYPVTQRDEDVVEASPAHLGK
jgi:two-component system OmpR family sensor kinase/two-component system sensor histidine kinase BaeS